MGPLILALAACAGSPPAAQVDERVSAMVRDLAEEGLSEEELLARQERAFELFQEAMDRYQAVEARALAEAMHRRAQATWSVFCVEGALRRAGDYDGAREALSRHLERSLAPDERTAVLLRRAIVGAGAGWTRQERADLGRGLARGASDAYQMLGRLALAQGRRDEARRLFGALLERNPGDPSAAPPWALRGFGLALLVQGDEPLHRSPR